MRSSRLWIRSETKSAERRAPIVPADARVLIARGFSVTVEESSQRVFPIGEYAAAGCSVAPAGGWTSAGEDEIIVGLKELPTQPRSLRHRHIYFGHAYKRQEGAADLLRRFSVGGGILLDLEYLVDDLGRRRSSFGYWAGYAGAALAVLHSRGRLDIPLRPCARSCLDAVLADSGERPRPRVLVIGAKGRAGHGALDACQRAGIRPTCWDIQETRVIDRDAIGDHDILINTVKVTRPGPQFLRQADLDQPDRRLRVVCDVTCDVTSDCNTLPIYDRAASWREPVLRLRGGERVLDLIAIDNLPSLLPREASTAFSAELTPMLLTIGDDAPVWQRCEAAFRKAVGSAITTMEDAHA